MSTNDHLLTNWVTARQPNHTTVITRVEELIKTLRYHAHRAVHERVNDASTAAYSAATYAALARYECARGTVLHIMNQTADTEYWYDTGAIRAGNSAEATYERRSVVVFDTGSKAFYLANLGLIDQCVIQSFVSLRQEWFISRAIHELRSRTALPIGVVDTTHTPCVDLIATKIIKTFLSYIVPERVYQCVYPNNNRQRHVEFSVSFAYTHITHQNESDDRRTVYIMRDTEFVLHHAWYMQDVNKTYKPHELAMIRQLMFEALQTIQPSIDRWLDEQRRLHNDSPWNPFSEQYIDEERHLCFAQALARLAHAVLLCLIEKLALINASIAAYTQGFTAADREMHTKLFGEPNTKTPANSTPPTNQDALQNQLFRAITIAYYTSKSLKLQLRHSTAEQATELPKRGHRAHAVTLSSSQTIGEHLNGILTAEFRRQNQNSGHENRRSKLPHGINAIKTIDRCAAVYGTTIYSPSPDSDTDGDIWEAHRATVRYLKHIGCTHPAAEQFMQLYENIKTAPAEQRYQLAQQLQVAYAHVLKNILYSGRAAAELALMFTQLSGFRHKAMSGHRNAVEASYAGRLDKRRLARFVSELDVYPFQNAHAHYYPNVRFTICLDVSGSMDYLVVINYAFIYHFVKTVRRIPGMSAQICAFNAWLLREDEPIDYVRIAGAGGTTPLHGTLQGLYQHLRSRRDSNVHDVLIVVTDGQPDSSDDTYAWAKKLHKIAYMFGVFIAPKPESGNNEPRNARMQAAMISDVLGGAPSCVIDTPQSLPRVLLDVITALTGSIPCRRG